MIQVQVLIEADSVRASPGGSLTANIWLALDRFEFPTYRWNDFAVVILSWWVSAALDLIRNNILEKTIHFMDGPYAVEVAIAPLGMLRFRALEGVGRNIEIANVQGHALPFIESVVFASHMLIEECKRLQWWSADAEVLSKKLELLEHEIKHAAM
jgi:hypothetical protein